jgi:hypothetical protein
MKYSTLVIGAITTLLTTFVKAGPNLTPAVYNFAIQMGYVGEATEVQDGCIPNGTHNVLRFDFYSKNIGDADFIAGQPIARPDLFYYHLSHHHFHMREFNQYRLVQVNGSLTIPSTKPGFCLADVVELVPNAAPQQFSLTCAQNAVMGISAGWADVYTADLTCQYLVIDDVPDGDYVLIVATNAARKVPEDTFDDNTVSVGLHIQGSYVWTTTMPAGFNYTFTHPVTTSSSVQIASIVSPSTTAVPVTSTSVPVSQTGVPVSATGAAVPSSSAAAKVSIVQELFIAITIALALTLGWNTQI